MAANPASKFRSVPPEDYMNSSSRSSQSSNEGFGPRAMKALHFGTVQDQRELCAYTEEQVAGMLQVSRSQLRKWRMGWSRGRPEGPPFKKLGRMIRYPASGLRGYIYGP